MSTSLYACVRAPRAPDLPIAVAKDFSPRWQRYGDACVVLDVGGLGRLLGDAQAIGAELHRVCGVRGGSRSAMASIAVAVAPTQAAALLLSGAAIGLSVVVERTAVALADLSLDVLRRLAAEAHGVAVRRGRGSRTASARRWEADEQAFEVFRRWGLRTLGDLTRLPAADLSARLGPRGVELQQQASGIDTDPLVPDPEVVRFIERMELEWPIDDLEPLSFVLARLLDPLASALDRADRGAAAIRLDLRLVDRRTHTRQLQLPAVIRDPRVLRTLLVLDLESHPPPAAIDVVAIEIDPAPARIVQYSLIERARPSAETLATLTARLSALVGESRSGAARLCDSHGPDAFEMRPFAVVEETRPRAEPTAMETSARAIVLRRFRPPVAVRVTVERGRPVRVAIDRRGMPGGAVEQSAGPWRSSGAWWIGQPQAWNRDEWDVALADGSVCRLFHARDTGHWFLEGTVD
jgi:protein ImuB